MGCMGSVADVRIRLVVADDYPVVRQGVERAVVRSDEMEIVGEAGSAGELLQLLESMEAPPDVVLLDLAMPGVVGLELVHCLRDLHPDLRILIYTMYEEDRVGIRCLKAGAQGFLHKASGPKRLVEAIRCVAQGQRYVSPALAEQLIALAPDPRTDPPRDRLTPRELEVLRALAAGHSTKEVAERLGLSVKTVHTHRARILDKLSLRSNVDLAHYAIEQGLLGWTPGHLDER